MCVKTIMDIITSFFKGIIKCNLTKYLYKLDERT
jgi:hypothetical protein